MDSFLRGKTVYLQATVTGVQETFVYCWWSVYIVFVYQYFLLLQIFFVDLVQVLEMNVVTGHVLNI